MVADLPSVGEIRLAIANSQFGVKLHDQRPLVFTILLDNIRVSFGSIDGRRNQTKSDNQSA